MKTYLFYDIETSGLNPAFDQLLTFACIRTDLELNEINRQTITVRLRKDIVPSPKAFLTHGLTYDELALGVSEYEAAIQIHTLVNTPDTISLGYNSLGFDDEFLRFLFYRNLLDPYLHQYGNGCSRMDILPIAVLFRIFHPQCLNWPEVDGRPSLKLDLITQANNFKTSGRAHEAMNDVEAVIGLAKRLFQQKKIWRYCLDFFNKRHDEVRINNIKCEVRIKDKDFRTGLMVSTSFGSKLNFMVPVIHLGQSLAYKNQSLWLRLDSEDIIGLDAGVKLEESFVIRKRPGDALLVLPALERFQNKIPASSQVTAAQNLEKLGRHGEAFFEFIFYHLNYKYPFIPDMDTDASLYQDGFFSSREKKQCDLFHTALSQLKPDPQTILDAIKSQRIKRLAQRILVRNFENTLENTINADWDLYLKKLRSPLEKDQVIGYKNDSKYNRKNGLQALKELETEILNPTQDQRQMLGWLKTYIQDL